MFRKADNFGIKRSTTLLSAILALTAACARHGGEEPTASLALTIGNPPEELRCLNVIIQTDRRNSYPFDWSEVSEPVVTLTGLPAVPVVLSVEAYDVVCGAAKDPTWVGGPVARRLHPGDNGSIDIAMRPAGMASVQVRVSFGGAERSPLGWACLKDDDCASQHCSATNGAIGTCQADAPAVEAGAPPDTSTADAGAPSTVTVPSLTQTTGYLIYAAGGDASCNVGKPACPPEGRCIFATIMHGSEPAPCVPPNMVPIPLSTLQICTAGQGCRPCIGDECLPTKCFQPLPTDRGCNPAAPLPRLRPTDDAPIVFVSQVPSDEREAAQAGVKNALPLLLQARAGTPPEQDGIVIDRKNGSLVPFVVAKIPASLRDPAGKQGDCGDPVATCGVFPVMAPARFPPGDWGITEISGAGQVFVWSFSP